MKPKLDNAQWLVAVVPLFPILVAGYAQTVPGLDSKDRNRNAVIKIEEGFVDAQGVLIYYKAFGNGPSLLILHGGPGASHDYFLPGDAGSASGNLVPMRQSSLDRMPGFL